MSHKVLVVDDDPVLLRMVCRYLVRRDFVVESATDGEDALERAQTFQPDLVLSDVRMPRMDGTALLAALKLRGVTAPVVFLTGYNDLTDAELIGKGPPWCWPSPSSPRRSRRRCSRCWRVVEPERARLSRARLPQHTPCAACSCLAHRTLASLPTSRTLWVLRSHAARSSVFPMASATSTCTTACAAPRSSWCSRCTRPWESTCSSWPSSPMRVTARAPRR
ncbi:MAG: response regulator [Archangiaceae bacterium]|nr:response regulator [Archangiaceae bacterium]